MGILIIIVVFFLFYPSQSILRITLVKTGNVLLCEKMKDGEEFILSFTHSVNKRPVDETIRIEGDHLLIVKSRFDSFGAGMPEASTDTEKLQWGQDGWLEWVVNRPVPEIRFFVGWMANHSLRLKGRTIFLKDLVDAGTLLSLQVQKASLYDIWKGGCIQ